MKKPPKTAERLDLESRGRLAAEKRKKLRKQDICIRESETRKTRTRNDPRYSKIDERLNGEKMYNFWFRIAIGGAFSAFFLWMFYSIYVDLNWFLQLGNAMTYSLIGSAIALVVSYVVVKKRAYEKRGEKINYRDLNPKMNGRQAAYEGIAVLLNACFLVFGLISVIKTLPMSQFVLAFLITKIVARAVAWCIARYANRRGFLIAGIVAIVVIFLILAFTPLFTIQSVGGG